MKYKNIIITVLLLCTIGIGLFSVLRNKKEKIPEFCRYPDKSYDKECVRMSEESKWANAGEDMPKGWVTWEDSIDGITVSAKGPIKYGPSRVITTGDIDLVTRLREKDSSIRCVGDLEIATCAIGNHPEVTRYWNVKNYFY